MTALKLLTMISYYQGADVDIDIVLWQDEEKTIPVSIDSLIDLYVFVYTTGCYVVKFSKNSGKQNFAQMKRIDEFTYRCSIPSASTRKLAPGAATVEINAVTNGYAADGTKNEIGASIAFALLPAKISEVA